MLRCIRCGACMNHCVVFRQLGGHVYGGTYPGPMGAVLTPVFDGLESIARPPARVHDERQVPGSLPGGHPAADPAARLARPLLARGPGAGHGPFWPGHPHLRRITPRGCTGSARRSRSGDAPVQPRRPRAKGMPGLGAWTAYREVPAPAKRTFMAMYKDQEKGDERTRNHPRRRAQSGSATPRSIRRRTPRRGRAAAGPAVHPPGAAGRGWWTPSSPASPAPRWPRPPNASPARASCRRRSGATSRRADCPRWSRCSLPRCCRPWTGPGSRLHVTVAPTR